MKNLKTNVRNKILGLTGLALLIANTAYAESSYIEEVLIKNGKESAQATLYFNDGSIMKDISRTTYLDGKPDKYTDSNQEIEITNNQIEEYRFTKNALINKYIQTFNDAIIQNNVGILGTYGNTTEYQVKSNGYKINLSSNPTDGFYKFTVTKRNQIILDINSEVGHKDLLSQYAELTEKNNDCQKMYTLR